MLIMSIFPLYILVIRLPKISQVDTSYAKWLPRGVGLIFSFCFIKKILIPLHECFKKKYKLSVVFCGVEVPKFFSSNLGPE